MVVSFFLCTFPFTVCDKKYDTTDCSTLTRSRNPCHTKSASPFQGGAIRYSSFTSSIFRSKGDAKEIVSPRVTSAEPSTVNCTMSTSSSSVSELTMA